MKAALFHTLAPAAAAVIGSLATLARRPSPIVVNAIQHVAAGVVFAAAGSEILPQLKHEGALIPTAVGGGLGIAAMLGLKSLGERTESRIGLVALVAADVLIDGVVLGLGFQAGEKAGLLLTIALTVELLFLSLSLVNALEGGAKLVGATALIVLMLPVGVLLSSPFGHAPAAYVTAAFAFGLVALLYLVTEELLVEAHEIEDRPWTTALFFVAFLALLMLEEKL